MKYNFQLTKSTVWTNFSPSNAIFHYSLQKFQVWYVTNNDTRDGPPNINQTDKIA